METILVELSIAKNRGGEALCAHILGEGTTLLGRRDSSFVGVSKMARALILLEEFQKIYVFRRDGGAHVQRESNARAQRRFRSGRKYLGRLFRRRAEGRH